MIRPNPLQWIWYTFGGILSFCLGVQIITGVVLPPDFTTFWKQALQQGFKPKVASIGKAILFPVALDALGKEPKALYDGSWSEWGARTDVPIEP